MGRTQGQVDRVGRQLLEKRGDALQGAARSVEDAVAVIAKVIGAALCQTPDARQIARQASADQQLGQEERKRHSETSRGGDPNVRPEATSGPGIVLASLVV